MYSPTNYIGLVNITSALFHSSILHIFSLSNSPYSSHRKDIWQLCHSMAFKLSSSSSGTDCKYCLHKLLVRWLQTVHCCDLWGHSFHNFPVIPIYKPVIDKILNTTLLGETKTSVNFLLEYL